MNIVKILQKAAPVLAVVFGVGSALLAPIQQKNANEALKKEVLDEVLQKVSESQN